MSLDNTQQNTQPTLDPTVVNLAKSIRQQESGGNYQDVGDNGTSYGAYQWQPNTWKDEATQYLGANAPASPLDATPAQQEEVAYKTLADWKAQGLSQKQSASKWNSGNPNAYQENDVGTNSKLGVNYNVPQYVNNVAKNYQAISSNQPFTTSKGGATDTSSQTSGMPTWEKIALGIGGTAAVAGGIAFAPEIAAGGTALAEGASGLLDSASSIPLIGKFIPGIAADLGINKAVGAVKGLLGGNSTTNINAGADEESNATEQAGQTEANATTQAEENQSTDAQDTAGEQATQQQNQNNENTENTQNNQAVQDEETETQNLLKQEQQTTQALNNTLSSTPTGKLLAQQPQVQETLQGMARNGYVPDTSTGYNDVNDANEKADKDLGELSGGVAKVLDAEGGSASIEEVRQNAYANIKKYVPIPEQEQATALVDKQLAAYQKAYGDNFTLGNIERAKREQGQAKGDWQKDTPTKNGHKSLYHAMRDTITKNTKHKDLYNRTMKEEQKIYDAKKILKKINGKKAFEHKGILRGALKSYGKYVGTYIGDKLGGVLGAIVGTMVGDHLTKAVDKRFGKTYFESKEGKKLIELASKKSPAMAKVLKKELQKYGVKAEAMKKEAEERIKKGHLLSSGAIPMGAKTSKDEIKILDAKKNPTSVNPKSGKFQTSYNSEGMMPKKELSKKLEGLFGGNVSQRKPKKKK
jgi:hypothetical protein